ncbi:MAG TPA: hypothetical protein VF299_08075 [Mycobacterium sp.]
MAHSLTTPRLLTAVCGSMVDAAAASPGIDRIGDPSPMRTGHHRQPDGSVVRVDLEMGHWVGSLYTPEMNLKTQFVGSDLEVHAWAVRIAL